MLRIIWIIVLEKDEIDPIESKMTINIMLFIFGSFFSCLDINISIFITDTVFFPSISLSARLIHGFRKKCEFKANDYIQYSREIHQNQ